MNKLPSEQLLSDLDIYTQGKCLDNDLKREIATMRGEIYESMSLIEEAEECYGEALSLALDGTYPKYVIQLMLGTMNQDPLILLNAIRTSICHGKMECISVLNKLIDIIPSYKLDPSSRDIVVSGIEVSWNSIRLEGEPPVSIDESIRLLNMQVCRVSINSSINHGSMSCTRSLCRLIDLIHVHELDRFWTKLIEQGIIVSWKSLGMEGVPPKSIKTACRELHLREFDDRS